MKKIIALILALTMIMSLAACGSQNAEEPAEPSTPSEPEAILPEEPAQPEETPEQDAPASGSDLPVEYPSSGSDLPDFEYPASGSDLAAGDNLPLSILETVWATYADEEKFAAAGGDYENMVMDAPGACGLSDAEGLNALFGIPAASLGSVSAAASLMHMMNANTFTSACYELNSGADAEAFAAELKDNILARQWMCGFPETLLIIEVEGCVISAFGNGEIIRLFKDKVAASYESTVLVEEPIA